MLNGGSLDAQIMEILLAKAGGPERAREMVRAAEPRTGKTALHFAAENGSVAMVELLLRQGAGEPPPLQNACLALWGAGLTFAQT